MELDPKAREAAWAALHSAEQIDWCAEVTMDDLDAAIRAYLTASRSGETEPAGIVRRIGWDEDEDGRRFTATVEYPNGPPPGIAVLACLGSRPSGNRSGRRSHPHTGAEAMSEATTNAVPNPGSDEAYMRGCKCARVDNAYGRGYMGGVKDKDGSTVFVYTEGCPLHWPKPALRQQEEGQ